MIVVKARLKPATESIGMKPSAFYVLKLTNDEGEDLTDLVVPDEPFGSVEELNAFLTLRLAREARAEITE